jgi:hypothetical protein
MIMAALEEFTAMDKSELIAINDVEAFIKELEGELPPLESYKDELK